MPYKIETEHIKLPRKLDRRVKLTENDKIEILNRIKLGHNKTELAQEFGIHRKTIYYLLNPEKQAEDKLAYKERRKDGRYYKKDKHTVAVQHTRIHRKKHLMITHKENVTS